MNLKESCPNVIPQLVLKRYWKIINKLLVCKTVVHVICASNCILCPEKYAEIQVMFRKWMYSEIEDAKHTQILPENSQKHFVQQHL